MIKWGRNYVLTVQVSDTKSIDITLPLTLDFRITRNALATANTAKFTVYNLNENTRRQIYKDKFSTTVYKGVELRAGYGEKKEDLPLIFKGNIKQAYSMRQNVDYITEIECYDGGFAFLNSYTNTTFAEGTPDNQVLDNLIKTLPGVNKGIIGDFNDKLPRGNAFCGTTTNLLNQISKGNFFIDNEKAYCLKEEECFTGNINMITSESGLLGSPLREEALLTFEIVFEPRLLIGQIIELKSETESNFNGKYKVISFEHNGTISDAVNGRCVTKAGLYYGTKQLRVVK